MDVQDVVDLQQTNEVWLLLVRRVRGYVDDDGILKRPYLLLLYEIAPNTILRASEVVTKHRLGYFPKPDYIFNLLVNTMRERLTAQDFDQPPHRPKTVIFTSKPLYAALQNTLTKTLRIRPQYWTEEENQGFGDDAIERLSNKLVEKEGFGIMKNSKKPGLLQVDGVTPELVSGLFKGATAWYREKPWKIFPVSKIFTVSWGQEIRFFAVTGQKMEPGMIMETSLTDLLSILQTGKKTSESSEGRYHAIVFSSEEAMPFNDLENQERYGWELYTDPSVRPRKKKLETDSKEESAEEKRDCWPLPVCFPSAPPNIEQMTRPSRRDITWYEVACFAIGEFTKRFRNHLQAEQETKGNSETTLKNIEDYKVFLSVGSTSVNVNLFSEDEWDQIEGFYQREMRKLTAQRCVSCGKRETEQEPLKSCGRCKKKLYCDRNCQAKDWNSHKTTCKPPA